MDRSWQNARRGEQIDRILKELFELQCALVLLETNAREEEQFQKNQVLQRSLQTLLAHLSAEFG